MRLGDSVLMYRRRMGGEGGGDGDEHPDPPASSSSPSPSSPPSSSVAATGGSSSSPLASTPLQLSSSAMQSPSSSISSPAPSPTSALSNTTEGQHHVDSVRVVLGSVLGLVGLLLILGIAFFLYRRRYRHRRRLDRPKHDIDPDSPAALHVNPAPAPPYTPPILTPASTPARAPSMRQVDRGDRSATHTPAGTPLSRTSMLTSLSLSSMAHLSNLPPLKAAMGNANGMDVDPEMPPPEYQDQTP